MARSLHQRHGVVAAFLLLDCVVGSDITCTRCSSNLLLAAVHDVRFNLLMNISCGAVAP